MTSLTFEEVQKYIELNGDQLESDSYINNKQLLLIKCGKCEEHFDQTFDRYKRGFRHKKCKKKLRVVKQSQVKVAETCKNCFSSFIKQKRKQKYCSMTCRILALKEMSKTEKHKLDTRRGGQISASKQLLRSKNEMFFAELCKEKFSNVLTNVPMFDGWDCDVILPDLKIAVAWNGIWHYEQVGSKHSIHDLESTIRRDLIKTKVIQKHGFDYYIIKDMGKANKKFVSQEFENFLSFVESKNQTSQLLS